jgi:hypothetical protein
MTSDVYIGILIMAATRRTPPRKYHLDEDLPPAGASDAGEFCTNCNDIEDMAVTDEPDDIESIRRRFRECERTGKFEGDICSRLYIADTDADPGPLFEDKQ